MPKHVPADSERHDLVISSAAQQPAGHRMGDDFDELPPIDETTSIELRRALGALRRYRWWIVATVLIGTAAGAGIGAYLPAEYEARSTIWVEVAPQGEAAYQGPIRAGQLLQAAGWIDLLRSYVVLDHVVQELKLFLDTAEPGDSTLFEGFQLKETFRPGSYALSISGDGKDFTLVGRDKEILQSGTVGDSVGQELGFAWAPAPGQLEPGRTIRFTVANPRDIARRLGQNVTPVMSTPNFLRIQLTGSDPDRIAATVNAVTKRLVDIATEMKNAKLNEQAALLLEQLQRAEERLRQADNELESFRIATITEPTERATPVAPGLLQTRDPVFNNFFNMKIEQDQIRRDRDAIKQVLDRSDGSPISVAALEYIGAVRNSSELFAALQTLTTLRTELRALQTQYTDEHPAVRSLLERIAILERETIPLLARALIAELENRDAQIEANVRAASAELQQIPARQLQEAQLTRQMRMAEELYSSLRMRYETARLAAASSSPDVRILEWAIPPRRPVVDMQIRVMIMAFAGSLALALLGAVLRDRFDPRIRYPEQVTRGMNLKILGAVPFIKEARGKGATDTNQVIEAFRELRLSLLHAYGTAGPLVTVITSSGSGDGKSFISGNLSLSFSDQGYQTLLIDGDIRRGAQHRLLGLTGKPGLTDYLTGQASLDEVIRSTPFPHLHLLPCGTRLQGGVELLGSRKMSELLVELRKRFGVIIIDSPPLGAGVDPFVLSTIAGHMLLVLRADYTDLQFTEAKLAMLERLPVRILGAILNAVPARGAYRYYSYIPGYEEVGEEQKLVVAADRLIGTAPGS